MGGFTQAVRKALLDHYFGESTLTAPTIHVGLSTTTPTDTGTNVTEPSGNNYARVQTAASDWNAATSADPNLVDNANAITFGQASGSWGTVTHAVLFDAATTGNVLGWGALSPSKAIAASDTASFAAGAIDVTLDGV